MKVDEESTAIDNRRFLCRRDVCKAGFIEEGAANPSVAGVGSRPRVLMSIESGRDSPWAHAC
jgi:hypothetical protein